MTVATGQSYAYHIGIAVADLDATAARFTALLGEMHWQTFPSPFPSSPFNTAAPPAQIKVALGRTPGLTFELVQVLSGETIHSDFLRRHGEGVHHIGLWVPDVQADVDEAVAKGATIRAALLRDDAAAVHLTAGDTAGLLAAIHPRRFAYVDGGAGGVEIEYVGPAPHAAFQSLLREQFANIIVSPPWLSV